MEQLELFPELIPPTHVWKNLGYGEYECAFCGHWASIGLLKDLDKEGCPENRGTIRENHI